MIYNRYMDINKFIEDTFDVLLSSEAQNNMMVGNALLGQKYDAKKWFMATVCDDNNSILLTALQMPMHYIVLYETGNTACDEALAILNEHILEEDLSLPGVLSEAGLSRRFSELYCNSCNISYKIDNSMNILEMTELKPFTKSQGRLRLATESDMYYLPYWDIALRAESELDVWPLKNIIANTKNRISSNHLYVWEKDIPCSTASIGRLLINGANINSAYTPPMYRNNGYSKSCISTLSELIMSDPKNKFCCVFVGKKRSYESANRLYSELGYNYVCDYDSMKFLRLY